MNKSNHLLIKLILFFVVVTNYSAFSQPLTSKEIDSLVQKTMTTFDVPGIAVAVIKDNKVIHSKGYGVRSLRTNLKVDANTLFGIASNTKAFTTAALGMLVDEKKLSWDDRVIDYIPEFRLYDPYVTQDFRIRDLLTHRSGLGLGAGDLMIWPGEVQFTKEEIIQNLRYLKQVSSFRTKYDYDNLMYIVAGEIVARVSGISWEEFIETRIMKPLNMTGSASTYSRIKDKSNVIDPHAPVDGVVRVIDRSNFDAGEAAGGIYSNINDLSGWVIMQMNNGRYPGDNEKRLFSERVHNEMWSPQTIINNGGQQGYNTHFTSYGLGWFLCDVKGYRQVWHTGGLAGIVTQVLMIPELGLGIIVLTNQQSGAAFNSISCTIKDRYLGVTGIDRVKMYRTSVERSEAEAARVTGAIWKEIELQQKKPVMAGSDTVFTGVYADNWFGQVTITSGNGSMRFESKKSPQIAGLLLPYKGNTFIAKWDDRTLDADAYVMFSLDYSGKADGMKMKAISPLTDFSFDFQDLDFHRLK